MSAPKGDQDVIRFVRIQPVHSCVVVGMVIKCIRTDKLAEVQLYNDCDQVFSVFHLLTTLQGKLDWTLGMLDPILGLIL